MTRRLHTADPHLFHDFVGRMRGYEDGTEWAEAFAEMWVEMVGPKDTVWVMGDLALSGAGLVYALDLLEMLPGRKHLVSGNHDACHPMHLSAHSFQAIYRRVFETVQADARLRMGGRKVRLSHFPTTGDHTAEPRHMEWRPRMVPTGDPRGDVLIHGHTHSAERCRVGVSGLIEVHVGLDAWDQRLVYEEQVLQTIATAKEGI